jgi:hypothetical protein
MPITQPETTRKRSHHLLDRPHSFRDDCELPRQDPAPAGRAEKTCVGFKRGCHIVWSELMNSRTFMITLMVLVVSLTTVVTVGRLANQRGLTGSQQWT